ncbi:MAG: hypothetical protein RIS47_2307 [Bacteroidota bacterium]|jgi:hypothetical protein
MLSYCKQQLQITYILTRINKPEKLFNKKHPQKFDQFKAKIYFCYQEIRIFTPITTKLCHNLGSER